MEIAIISKERPTEVLSKKWLVGVAAPVLFVEPQEYAAYKKANPELKVVKLPKNDMGLAYARNRVLDHFSGECVIQLDDDITDILKRDIVTKKLRTIAKDQGAIANLLQAFEGAFKKGFKLVSISYCPSNWYEMKPFKINSRVWCIMGINTDCKVMFDEACLSCADYDFTAQIIHKGFKSLVYYDWAFDCKPMTTNKGGCQSEKLMNRKDRTLKTYDYLLAKWGPNVVQAKKSEKLPLEIQFRWSRIP